MTRSRSRSRLRQRRPDKTDHPQERVVDGVTYVWSVLDNAWVTLGYWRWVNGRTP